MNSVNSLNSDSDEVRKLSIPNEKKSENVLDTPEEEVSILEHVEKLVKTIKKLFIIYEFLFSEWKICRKRKRAFEKN